MNILTKLTKRNLKLNKKRAVGTIIGIMLSVALICAVSGMFTSFRETLIQKTINERGYFHIAFETITKDKFKKYELNNDVEDINAVYEVGESTYVNAEKDDPYITIYSTTKEDFDKLSYTLLEGKFPANSNEIVISKRMALISGVKVGDTLELNVGQRKTNDGYELGQSNPYQGEDNEYIDNPVYKKYKVVGISYRERNNRAVYGITTGETNDNIHAYIALKHPHDYKQSFTELLGANSYDDIEFGRVLNNIDFQYTINNELLRWQVFAFSDSTISVISGIVSVVIVIIIIVSVFCIRNSFAISTTEKMKMYGMLASVGATKKQIKKNVILEGIILGLIGIPLGILCGIIAVFILVNLVNVILEDVLFNSIDGMVFKISLMPILISILLGFVTIYFSSISSAKRASLVSPIENLRNTKDIKITSKKLKTPKIISTIFKTGGVLAYKNLKRSKKKYRTTVISLAVSIFVFISMFYFVNEGFEQAGMYYTNYDYNITIYNGTFPEYDEQQISTLRNLNNINDSYLMYEYRGITKVLDESKINHYASSGLDESSVSVGIRALDSNSFKKYVKELGLNYNKVKNKGILMDDFKYWSNEEQKEIHDKRYNYKAGDTMNISLETSELKSNISIELAEVTREKPTGLENLYFGGGYLIVDKTYYDNIDFVPYRLMIDTDKPEELVNDIELIDSELVINNFDEQAKNERSMVIVISIFLYGFIAVITLIGVTNIFNTLTSNMELRQKEFAMLKSVGMTKKEFNRMINLETLFYCSKSLIYGTLFGILGSYAIHLGFNKKVGTAYQIPLTGIIISIVFVFIIVYIIMRYSISKINKQNTIETIRKENV
ncbi:MAG: ABC transporter permease [Bacilli bacterium]|nr:ABC transporter permease [Bacilli bacterium]